jgi:hypothetical protein
MDNWLLHVGVPIVSTHVDEPLVQLLATTVAAAQGIKG